MSSFVESELINEAMGAGAWLRAEVEYPHDLRSVSVQSRLQIRDRLTVTMERRIKPAAAASFAPSLEYTKAWTQDELKVKPAARYAAI